MFVLLPYFLKDDDIKEIVFFLNQKVKEGKFIKWLPIN